MAKKRLNKKFILNFITIILLIILGISLYKIVKYKIDEYNIKKQLDLIDNTVIIEEINDFNNSEIIKPKHDLDKNNPYWDYIKMNLIDVDFKKLKAINKHTKGWIQVNGTNINYPFVQTNNNEYYLNHSFDKSYNSAGWVFLDYRNNLSDPLEKNTILYAHSRLDKTMFGSLRNILTNGWLNNPTNYIIKLSNEYENTLWQVISVYHIPTTSDYIQTSFKSNNEFLAFANMLINRSSHNFNTTINQDDRILTLSSCYSKTEKVVLHAKLIKKESKSN